jgi:arginine kinase
MKIFKKLLLFALLLSIVSISWFHQDVRNELKRYFGYATVEDRPTFPHGSDSMLSEFLTDEIWNNLKDKKDKSGFTFRQLINSGIVNPNSSIGVYAGSADSYVTFAPLLDKIIEKYHGHSANAKHESRWDVSKLNDLKDLDPEKKYCISTRIRVARNFASERFGTCISKEGRARVEEFSKNAFATFEEDLQGTYYPIQGMSEENRKKLIEDHFLFKEGDKYLEAAGLNRDWPNNRGIFHNKNKTFLVWCNEEDHLRIISMQKGGDIKEVFSRLARASSHIEKQAKFAYNDHLGYLTTCPTNCGTGLRASVHVRLPLLSKDEKQFQKIANEHNVQIRGIHGEHSESSNGIYDVSNKRRLGFSETQLVRDMYNGVKAMIEAEKKLEVR